MDAMRRLLETNARDAIVSKGPHGTVQVRVGTIRTAILETRVSVLKLTPLEQYNPNLAILEIQRTSEVTSAMQRSGLRFPLETIAMITQKPAPGLPHLPSVIRDATVDEAMDLVAETFSGIVLYDECSLPRGGGGYLVLSFIGLD
jgi:hypothetical protein